MFDHIGLRTADLGRLTGFYRKTLAALDIALVAEFPGGAGYGKNGQPSFWLGQSEQAPSSVHIAFMATSREQVEAFYQAAISAGASDNGGPGLRPHYHAGYYAAFVIDPDGNNIEAVCHDS